MPEFDPTRIEARWQRRWEESGAFRVAGTPESDDAYYCLEMLPYPSGNLHMGHVRNYSIGDALARFQQMRGKQVMHVIGWDAFGMPAENAAIERGEDPAAWTRANIAAMRAQLQRLGLAYDWSREISTCDPRFYRWNQWFFLRMFERGLAYRARRALNWCASCETVLANEQVVSGRCWRCDGPVSRREFSQWFLRITDYASELLDALPGMTGWPDRVRAMQTNWIGRSTGARVRFKVVDSDLDLEVFTTRIDTIHGATYLALAAEHPAVERLVAGRREETAVGSFVRQQLSRDLEDRFGEGAEKLGIDTGQHAVNPFSGEEIPVWIANFVLMDVGTGAIMSVPAHDQRDLDFARTYELPVRRVIQPAEPTEAIDEATAFSADGILHDSGPYSGLTSAAARERMAADAESGAFGGATVVYRLKDWGISRQRYWGTPIPIVHCESCGPVGLPDEQLPLLLPEKAPLTGEGGSPLAQIQSFVHTRCPKCDGPGQRETDTMDTFVDSSWYYFRYLDPENSEAPFGVNLVASV